MLAKQNRLNRADFNRYFASGTRFHSPLLTVIYTPSTENRGSVVVSKKVAKAAHDRNRLRRRGYAILSAAFTNKAAQGIYIVVFKPAVARLTRLESIKQITEEIARVNNNQ
jgi:ribonuclease P protein component